MFSQIGVKETQTMNSFLEAEPQESVIHVTESEDIASLRLSFQKQSEFACRIIETALKYNINILNRFGDIVTLSFMEDSPEKVKKMQNVFYCVMEDVIKRYVPFDLSDSKLFSCESGKLAIEAIILHNEVIVVPIDKTVCDGYYSVTADFINWEFFMTKEETVKLKAWQSVSTENSLPANVIEEPYRPNLKDWYYLYCGKQQILNCCKQHKNEDIYIKADGSIATKFPEGFVSDRLRGWKFSSKTLDELISLLCDDDFDASFSDDQNAICVRGGDKYGC